MRRFLYALFLLLISFFIYTQEETSIVNQETADLVFETNDVFMPYTIFFGHKDQPFDCGIQYYFPMETDDGKYYAISSYSEYKSVDKFTVYDTIHNSFLIREKNESEVSQDFLALSREGEQRNNI